MKILPLAKAGLRLLLIAIIIESCSNNSSSTLNENSSLIDTTKSTQIVYKTQIDPYSTPAIGNLYLGVSLDEFEKQKTVFLKNTPQLAGQKIMQIIPLLYNDKVERIVLVSEKHMHYDTFQKNNTTTTSYWENLYDEKYGKGKWKEMNGKYYSVNDGVIKPLPYKEFLFEKCEEFEKAALQNVSIKYEQQVFIQHLNCYRYDAHSIIIITNKPLYDSLSLVRDKQDREEREYEHQNDLNTI